MERSVTKPTCPFFLKRDCVWVSPSSTLLGRLNYAARTNCFAGVLSCEQYITSNKNALHFIGEWSSVAFTEPWEAVVRQWIHCQLFWWFPRELTYKIQHSRIHKAAYRPPPTLFCCVKLLNYCRRIVYNWSLNRAPLVLFSHLGTLWYFWAVISNGKRIPLHWSLYLESSQCSSIGPKLINKRQQPHNK